MSSHPADQPLPDWITTVPFAHRGLHGDGIPENSLAAFAAARDAGVGIELDVHVTADGHAVVLHDHDLARVTGAPSRLADFALADLEALRLEGTDEAVPTLGAALDRVGGAVPVMVEIKNPTASTGALEADVARLLTAYEGPACVASFNPLTVRWMRREAPHLLRLQTAGPMRDVPGLPAALRPPLRRLWWNRWTRPHALSYDLRGLPAPVTERWRDRGRVVVAWTVSDAAQARHAAAVADNAIVEPWALSHWTAAADGAAVRQSSSSPSRNDRNVSS